MNDQQRNEIIKALAYGMTPEQIAEAEAVDEQEVIGIREAHGPEIAEARAEFEKGGFFDGD